MKAFLMGMAALVVVSFAAATVLSMASTSSQTAYSEKASVRQ